jgi:hypothetical protein
VRCKRQRKQIIETNRYHECGRKIKNEKYRIQNSFLRRKGRTSEQYVNLGPIGGFRCPKNARGYGGPPRFIASATRLARQVENIKNIEFMLGKKLIHEKKPMKLKNTLCIRRFDSTP